MLKASKQEEEEEEEEEEEKEGMRATAPEKNAFSFLMPECAAMLQQQTTVCNDLLIGRAIAH